MEINKKTMFLIIDLFLLIIGVWTVLAHVGIIPMPEIEEMDIWATANVSFIIASYMFFKDLAER